MQGRREAPYFFCLFWAHFSLLRACLADFEKFIYHEKIPGDVAQVVRASGSYPLCRGFKSLHHYIFTRFGDYMARSKRKNSF